MHPFQPTNQNARNRRSKPSSPELNVSLTTTTITAFILDNKCMALQYRSLCNQARVLRMLMLRHVRGSKHLHASPIY